MVFVLTDEEKFKHNLADSVGMILDAERTIDIKEIQQQPRNKWQSFYKGPLGVKPPYVAWVHIRLVNAGTQARNEYLSFCSRADSVWVFTVLDGAVKDVQLSGSKLKPGSESMPSSYNYAPISIDANTEKSLYVKILFHKDVHASHLFELSIQPAQPLIYRWMSTYSIHAFYAGVMMLFALISLFMYLLFRERIFIFLAVMMLGFILYFSFYSGLIDAFFVSDLDLPESAFIHWVLTAIVLSVSLMIREFIDLPQHLPRYHRIYIGCSIICAAIPHVLRVVGLPYILIAKIHNLVLVIWLLQTIIPVILLAYRKEKSAKVLLVSIGFLFLGSLLYVVELATLYQYRPWMQYGFQLGTILFSGILFYSLFDRINTIRSAQLRSMEANQLRSRFFANISHEFRTPLTLMKGPIRQVMERLDDTEDRALLALAYRNASRQLELVNQLLDLSKLDVGKLELRAAREDIVPQLVGMVYAYESLAVERGVTLLVDAPEDPCWVYFDRGKLEKIGYNLLSNAFKFTPAGGTVKVVITSTDKTCQVEIVDTGVGIEPERLPHIFDRFFQADTGIHTHPEGTGIGLALVRELVQLHHATISVTSKLGEGTHFKVEFLKGDAHLKPEQIIEVTDYLADKPLWTENIEIAHAEIDEEINPAQDRSETQEAKWLPEVLLIEDNDEVRAYIRQRLNALYHIREAKDGEEGIRLAVAHSPDLIVSDVMMPKKDGFAVCKALKTDIRTSHIPIILLTAKAGQEEKIVGLQTGADDYLLKPFDAAELEQRMRNLIALRRQLRVRFATSITLKPAELPVSALDQQLLEDAMRIIEAHLGEKALGVELLARELGMSKPSLNRKLRALLNQSTNQFIQSIRLQQAAELLQKDVATISEIAFRCGFQSTAYFVKCFKAKYGETPGNFKKSQ